MDLKAYDIIKDISVSVKSRGLQEKFGKLTFVVQKMANKVAIKDAVEKIWKVKVKSVNTINVKGKEKSFGRRSFFSPDMKKAIVTLHKGYKIELPGQFEKMGVESETGK